MGCIRVLEERRKMFFLIYKPNVQYQNGYSIFMSFCVDLIQFEQVKYEVNCLKEVYWRFCRKSDIVEEVRRLSAVILAQSYF